MYIGVKKEIEIVFNCYLVSKYFLKVSYLQHSLMFLQKILTGSSSHVTLYKQKLKKILRFLDLLFFKSLRLFMGR